MPNPPLEVAVFDAVASVDADEIACELCSQAKANSGDEGRKVFFEG